MRSGVCEAWWNALGPKTETPITTYGVIMHGILTDSINMDHPKEAIYSLKIWNAAIVSRADIQYIGWLTKASSSKKVSSAIVEFTGPEEANSAIREGLVWEAEQLYCELYDKSC